MAAMDFSVSVFQRKLGTNNTWITLGFGAEQIQMTGSNIGKVRDRLIGVCREQVRHSKPADLPALLSEGAEEDPNAEE